MPKSSSDSPPLSDDPSSSSSDKHPSSHVNSNSSETFTMETITDSLIPALLDQISKAQKFIPLPPSHNDDESNATISKDSKKSIENKTINEVNDGGSSIFNCFGSSINQKINTTTDRNLNQNQKKESDESKISIHSQHRHLYGQLEKLRRDIIYVKESFDELKKFEDNVNNPFKAVCQGVDRIVYELEQTPQGNLQTNDVQIQTKLRELNKILTNLKLHVPSAHKISSANTDAHRNMRPDLLSTSHAHNVFDGLRNIPMNERFLGYSAFNDLKEVYKGLDDRLKLCLLCFSVFPENAVVKRRVLSYWWVGEGLIVPPSSGQKTVEDVADDILADLVKKGFVEPVNYKQKPVADCFKMHPFVRFVVIRIAKEAEFFDFNINGNPTANFPVSHRACLTEEGSSFRLSKNSAQFNQEQLYTLFNVSEQYLKLEPDWFLKLRYIYVLQMGRWQSLAMHHIEVEDTEFLKRLKNMKFLMFFSLQGISRIMELPNTIGSLTNLRILDLRACHNLEVLPEEIGLLKNLTHLDMSECYLLESMPKGIAALLELQVLKGFMVGDPKSRSPCTLDDLKSLMKLRKLTINTGWEAFPTDKEIKSLQQFKALSKLKITWGGTSLEKSVAAKSTNPNNRGGGETKKDSKAAQPAIRTTSLINKTFSKLGTMKKGKIVVPETLALPTNLEKLDLQCCPLTKRPNWLKPSQPSSLRKLYIRGGTLSDLYHIDDQDQWTVEILRLKYLYELKMDWRELQESFPALKYLEKVQCPKLTFFPCNERGVWLKQSNKGCS